VLSRATSRGLVALLAKDHILGSKPPDLNQQLTSRAALIPAIEQAPVALPAFRHTRRGTQVLLASIFSSSVLTSSSLRLDPVQSVIVCHLSLHAK
jgi:hypothetical protein